MSVGSIGSSYNPYQSTASNPFTQIRQGMQSLGQALQSGNLTSAQSAFNSLMQALPGVSSSSASATSAGQASSSSTNPIGTDLQSLQTALKSGNIPGAQTAFSQLQTDLKSAQGAHGGHHHHGGGGGMIPSLSTNSSSSTSATSATSTSNSTSSTTSTSATSLITSLLAQLTGTTINAQG